MRKEPPPPHAMTTYFILDSQSNTWSDTHYPLSSILATPGITGEHILANARTRETMTVAQAQSIATPAASHPTAAARTTAALRATTAPRTTAAARTGTAPRTTVASGTTTAARPAAATKLKPSSKQVMKPMVGNSLTLGTTLGKTVKQPQAADQIPLSAMTSNKPTGPEYRVLSQNDSCFNGQFSSRLLAQELNRLAQKGWKVINMGTATAYTEDGTEYHELMILLERNRG